MTNKQIYTPDVASPAGANNLKAIRHIGRAIERRLHNAGIHTYDQLADLTPAKVIELIGEAPGLSVASVTEQDWAGQARALAARQAPALEPETPKSPEAEQQAEHHNTPEALPEESASRQRNATFTVELLLDTDGTVRRTRVAHFQSGQVELQPLCPGWDSAQLVEYIVERANLRVAEPSQGTVEQSPAPESAKPLPPRLNGEPTLRTLAVVPSGDDRPHNVLHRDQTFQVQLALDLADVVIPAEQKVSYVATVLAKRMGSSGHEKLGEAYGQASRADMLALDIDAGKLPEGLYRLEAIVDLAVLSDATEQSPTHKTQLKGGLLQIY